MACLWASYPKWRAMPENTKTTQKWWWNESSDTKAFCLICCLLVLLYWNFNFLSWIFHCTFEPICSLYSPIGILFEFTDNSYHLTFELFLHDLNHFIISGLSCWGSMRIWSTTLLCLFLLLMPLNFNYISKLLICLLGLFSSSVCCFWMRMFIRDSISWAHDLPLTQEGRMKTEEKNNKKLTWYFSGVKDNGKC